MNPKIFAFIYLLYFAGAFTVGALMAKKSIQAWEGRISRTLAFILFPLSTVRFYDWCDHQLEKWMMMDAEDEFYPQWLPRLGIRRVFEVEGIDGGADSEARQLYTIITYLLWPIRLSLNLLLAIGIGLWYGGYLAFTGLLIIAIHIRWPSIARLHFLHWPKKNKIA